jgi:hypothetical protein
MSVMSERSATRTTFISFSAALQALGSVLLLCFAIMGNFPDKTLPTIYVLLAAIGLLTAAGNFRLKKWARYSTSVFSVMLILFPIGIVWYYEFLNSLRDPNNAADDDLMAYMAGLLALLLVIAMVFAALGGFWLYYFNRSSIRQLFAKAERESS